MLCLAVRRARQLKREHRQLVLNYGFYFLAAPISSSHRQYFDTQQRLGCDVIWLEPDELKHKLLSINVSDLGAAVYSRGDGWLDPHSVLMGFRKKAMSLGTEFLLDEVTGLARQGNSVHSATLKSGRNIQASRFVNAAAAWAKDICTMVDVKVPIEPLRRFEQYFECQTTIEPLLYLKDMDRLAFRSEGKGYSGGVRTLEEPRGHNFNVDRDYFEAVVWPALAHRFPQFEGTGCKYTLPGLYDQNDFDGNVIIGPDADGPGSFHMLAGFSGHGLMNAPGCGKAMAELLIKGRYETIDLTRLGWQRLLDASPLFERGII